jgi:hypothetical protein
MDLRSVGSQAFAIGNGSIQAVSHSEFLKKRLQNSSLFQSAHWGYHSEKCLLAVRRFAPQPPQCIQSYTDMIS